LAPRARRVRVVVSIGTAQVAALALRTLIAVWLPENDLAGAKAYLKTLKERFPEAVVVKDCEIAVTNKEREAQQPK
jgi:hypothetical protein